MPRRKVTGFLFYMNWNLTNYSATADRQELESFFRMCDRKWSVMSEQEKDEWKLKLQSNRNFEPHKLLYLFLHNVQCDKGQRTRHVPFEHMFPRFEYLDDPKFQSMRRHGSSLFLNSFKLSRRNLNLQLSYALIGVSFSGDTVVDSRFVEIDLLKFKLEFGIIKTAGVTIDTEEWSLPLDVKDILKESSYLVCEGLKYSAVAEVMRFIWAKDRRLGIPPQLLLMEDFINTVVLCNEQKNEEDIVLPPLMNCDAVEVQFPIGCSHHTFLSTVDFPCAKEESFIALKEIFRQIQNVQPTFFKSEKLLEILENQRKAHIDSSHQEDDTAMNTAFENLCLIDIVQENTEQKLPVEDKMKTIDDTQPVKQYPMWFKVILDELTVLYELRLEDRMKSMDNTQPMKRYPPWFRFELFKRRETSEKEYCDKHMKFYANMFEGPGRYHIYNNEERAQVFPFGKREVKSFYDELIPRLNEAAIIFDEDKHEMPALDHSKEKKYEEEFDVYDNEDPKREERLFDYYYETAEYIENSNQVYSYFVRTASDKRDISCANFDED
ncbi:FACT complex subunit [Trichinella spiralis]|uniref:FACT complex subunit n=1 Tax=Trichinella spiralis TaxID=6334 RepID=A0ABR3K714_TRISP